MANAIERYKQTFTSYGGCDISAFFNGRNIAELQGVTINITREIAPIYTLGSANPRSFSRNKRGIAGTLVFSVFNRDALIEEMKKQINEHGKTITIWSAEVLANNVGVSGWDEYNSLVASGFYDPETNTFDAESALRGGLVVETEFEYSDQIPPFDITIVFQNEFGQASKIEIYGVQIMSSGTGISVDDTTMEMASTFVARSMKHMIAIDTSVITGKNTNSSSGTINKRKAG
jgi:hypothetical protein